MLKNIVSNFNFLRVILVISKLIRVILINFPRNNEHVSLRRLHGSPHARVRD